MRTEYYVSKNIYDESMVLWKLKGDSTWIYSKGSGEWLPAPT